MERRGEIHVVVAVRAACADFLSLLGQRAAGLFSAQGEQINHDFITAGVSASFAFFFCCSTLLPPLVTHFLRVGES